MTSPEEGKQLVESHERSIAALERRQAGLTYLPPLPAAVAERKLAAHRAVIARHTPGGDSFL